MTALECGALVDVIDAMREFPMDDARKVGIARVLLSFLGHVDAELVRSAVDALLGQMAPDKITADAIISTVNRAPRPPRVAEIPPFAETDTLPREQSPGLRALGDMSAKINARLQRHTPVPTKPTTPDQANTDLALAVSRDIKTGKWEDRRRHQTEWPKD